MTAIDEVADSATPLAVEDARVEAQKSYDLGAKVGPMFFLEPEVKKALAEWSKKG